MGAAGERWAERWITAPSFLWLLCFFALPTALVLILAFQKADPYGGVGDGWSLEAFRQLANPSYPAILWRTLWMSALTALICLGLATPAAYAIARSSPAWRNRLLLLVIVPFWTNFLIRVFAWKTLLHPEGLLKRGLAAIGLLGEDAVLIYRPEAVLLVLIYTSLPFAILPVYAAAEKFDFQLLEAAQDLGASRWGAVWKVFLPGISRGLATAGLMVFIPALGAYVVPEMVGGPNAEMLGNKIAQRVFVDRNLPHAAMLSSGLTLAVVAPALAWTLLQRKRSELDPMQGGGEKA